MPNTAGLQSPEEQARYGAVGYVDLHSHILPGLDDGAPDPAATMDMLQGLAALGYDTVCATPHQKAGQFLPSAEAIRTAHHATVAAAQSAGLGLHIPLAAENMWDAVFFERFQGNCIPSYESDETSAPGRGKAFLVEFRVQELPAGLSGHLFRMRAAGRLPVIAHPERYQPLWKTPELVEELATQCALVVDLGAVAGYHGRRETKVARTLLSEGIAHAAATDIHAPSDIRVAAEGLAWIRKKLGDAALRRLCDEGPRRILAGLHPRD